jgi:hypothetical protein
MLSSLSLCSLSPLFRMNPQLGHEGAEFDFDSFPCRLQRQLMWFVGLGDCFSVHEPVWAWILRGNKGVGSWIRANVVGPGHLPNTWVVTMKARTTCQSSLSDTVEMTIDKAHSRLGIFKTKQPPRAFPPGGPVKKVRLLCCPLALLLPCYLVLLIAVLRIVGNRDLI